MGKEEKSSSIEQQMAEQIIFQKVNDWLGVELVENAKIFVGNTFMQPDFYSKADGIIGEIYAHIGKQKQWYHLQASTRWNGSVYKGFVGKLVKDNNIQVIHNIQENISLKYTYTEIKDFIESLKDIFTVVRLIDFQKHQSAKAENDQIEIIEGNCYDYWKRKDVCVNCISKQAYIKKGQAFKLEFVDYNIYAIIAQYVEVDERPWVLELVYKTKEDIILGAHGKTRFLENIVTYNKEYYTDVLTTASSYFPCFTRISPACIRKIGLNVLLSALSAADSKVEAALSSWPSCA